MALTINRDEGTAKFDFSGTGFEVYGMIHILLFIFVNYFYFYLKYILGNCNAPPAVTKSAIIYCLRCLVKRDIPLNQGCLNPIGTFIIMFEFDKNLLFIVYCLFIFM